MGMFTVVTESSAVFSGGQVQRIMLAAALVRSPRVLLLDEATSWLDNDTQATVMGRIEELAVTRIVIAHRLSTIRNADRIYVLDEGRVAQQGTFAQLIEAPGIFRAPGEPPDDLKAQAPTFTAMLIVAAVTLLAPGGHGFRHPLQLPARLPSRRERGTPRRRSAVSPAVGGVAARNEELGAEQALSSLLGLDYPTTRSSSLHDCHTASGRGLGRSSRSNLRAACRPVTPRVTPRHVPSANSSKPLSRGSLSSAPAQAQKGSPAGGEDRQDRQRAEADETGMPPPRNAPASLKHRSRSRPRRRRNRRDRESRDRRRRDGRGPRARLESLEHGQDGVREEPVARRPHQRGRIDVRAADEEATGQPAGA